jgi:uncharacterized protein (DUF58 family)
MRFVFSRRFYFLLVLAVVPLSVSWMVPGLTLAVFAFDILLAIVAIVDYFISRTLPEGFIIEREFERRFAIGDSAKVTLKIDNATSQTLHLKIKDEYPAEMRLDESREAEFMVEAQGTAEFYYHVTSTRRGRYEFGKTAVRYLSRLGLVWCQTEMGEPRTVKVYPNMRRAREMELKALGARSFLAIQRRAVRRGEGREFESMRDYVRGDELRHIAWTTTARRGKLTTRQYQAALALMSAASRAGDNCGLVVFGRKVRKYLPPKRGLEHIDAVLEALHDLEPELIEPSYARAFQFIASNTKKRSFIVILTDLVDKDSSKELINSLKLLRPRHLPLVATIGDRDLNATVSVAPPDIKGVFTQSAAEEIIQKR